MLKRTYIVLCTLLLVLPSVIEAQEEHKLQLILKQAENSKEVDNVLANIIILDKETNDERMISSYVQKNPVTMSLQQGRYAFIFKIDSLQTPGKDYYGEIEIDLERDTAREVIVFPVGSFDGVVYDTLDNLVSRAALKIECNKEYGEKPPGTTDKVGSFAMAYAPIGECLITATSHNAVGSQRMKVEKGMSQHIELKLNKPVIAPAFPYTTTILIFIILGGAGTLIILFLRRQKKTLHHTPQEVVPKQETQEKVQKQPTSHLGKRTQDIINTLNEREKKVVTLLLEQHHQSTQAKVRYGTGIPKTSLVRIFTSLQNKKIISVETIGKLKKIKLTDWFLEKED
ncbi:hypothetical protein HYS50_02805 [Candidatus Woesearchaeota archaeon]|nr:hypothetical protein [Candidatus Woesearchaeota archaeon]